MFKIVLDLDRLKGKQRKALIDAGYFVGDTRFGALVAANS